MEFKFTHIEDQFLFYCSEHAPENASIPTDYYLANMKEKVTCEVCGQDLNNLPSFPLTDWDEDFPSKEVTLHDTYKLEESDIRGIIDHMIERELTYDALIIESELRRQGFDRVEKRIRLIEITAKSLAVLDKNGFSIREWVTEPHKVCILVNDCTCDNPPTIKICKSCEKQPAQDNHYYCANCQQLTEDVLHLLAKEIREHPEEEEI
jgi:hypothetical protein